MKKITGLFLFAALLLTFSCKNEKKDTHEETKVEDTHAAHTIASKTYIVSNSESLVNWEGTKKIGGGHNGTIKVVSGKFDVEGGKLTGGKVSIDMTSIDAVDMKDKAEKKAQLEGHLKDTDFFDVANYPVSTFEIVDASDMNAVKANLTIKDSVQEIVLPMHLETKDGKVMLTSDFSFDRTKFGITYNSSNFFKDLGDKIINDEVKLSVALSAK